MEQGNGRFSRELRKIHCTKALNILKDRLSRDRTERYALCILLGEVVFGDFFCAPWVNFSDLVEFYPELTEPLTPLDAKGDNWLLSIKERIAILETAIETINLTTEIN